MTEDVQPVVSPDEYYYDPAERPPPLGRNMYLLTCRGRAVIGMWQDGGGYIGWRPFFKMTKAMKEKVNDD